MSESIEPSFEIPQPNARGRQALQGFGEAMRHNAFEGDGHFRRVIRRYARPERRPALEAALAAFGQVVLGPLDEVVRKNNEPGNLPQLQRYTGFGERIEAIDHHPSYHEAGRMIYGSGVMAAYAEHPNTLGALSRFYLSSLNGEAGHNCPLACTAGVIRVLQELGSEELKARYLPGFLDAEYDNHLEGAQFLTEVQGGSDVGANATRALRAEDGSFRIYGEKWFCSNIDADVFLMTARVEELGQEGTRGLGLFLVPRLLEDGSVNEFYVRRLKDKLGTRSMASGECDFRGAQAFHMGELGQGFKHMMNLVINTSRLYNAVGCCGVMRRAYLSARLYAEHREAFGQPILNYPLVQETLGDMRAELEAMVSANFHLCALQDRLDEGEASEQEAAFLRMAININKSRTAISARQACVQGIEVLGGNGAIESFSVLPRLLRDAIVYENWEGTHNTLYMQVLRDMHRYRVHAGFFAYLSGLLDQVQGAEYERAEELSRALGELSAQVDRVLSLNQASASLAMRELVDQLATLFYGVVRVWERDGGALDGEDEAVDRASVEHFLDRGVREPRGVDESGYLRRLQTLAMRR
ncbi:acyl-CoA dehydrogenase [Lujinxingia litoralis]|uniref:Acyl-CoA dehydrogenase n=1 Tax=Lujinxingia litoralis TaxID=2211119 RepID=A0A328C370_9DELT|nr:acyl-CoA dehydrogenase family protein [Lujinxingia litoralis]RAL20237.1 acyl-CoA dehydrogenase [Lujinxingia litoralis]